MPPVEINSVRVTRKSPETSSGKKTLKSTGRIRSVSHDYGDRYARVEVSHGRKSTPKKNAGVFPSDNRPTSSFAISKAHAHHFPVGKRVNITMSPMSDDGDDESGDDMGNDEE